MPQPRPFRASTPRVRRALVGFLAGAALTAGAATAILTISTDRVGAVWSIESEIGESSQIVPIRAAHPDCASWASLGGLVVKAVETNETVTITATFPKHAPERPCDANGLSMPGSVRLNEPLGDRTVIDGHTGQDPATPDTVALHTGEPRPEN